MPVSYAQKEEKVCTQRARARAAQRSTSSPQHDVGDKAATTSMRDIAVIVDVARPARARAVPPALPFSAVRRKALFEKRYRDAVAQVGHIDAHDITSLHIIIICRAASKVSPDFSSFKSTIDILLLSNSHAA